MGEMLAYEKNCSRKAPWHLRYHANLNYHGSRRLIPQHCEEIGFLPLIDYRLD
jgi:hypothetical protein